MSVTGELSAINISPLSGARLLPLDEADVNVAGLVGDRWYVAYDPEDSTMIPSGPGSSDRVVAHKRIDQKNRAALATIDARIMDDGRLALATDDGRLAYVVPRLAPRYGRGVRNVNEFGDLTPCHDLGEEAAAVLSSMLGGKAVALALKAGGWRQGAGLVPPSRAIAPLHIVNAASVEALQDMKEAAGMEFDAERFRPNFVVEGFDPFFETEWVGKIVKIGDVAVKITRMTERCNVTGRDPRTGQQQRDVPKLLQGLHVDGNKLADFGVYGYPLVPYTQTNQVRQGDAVSIAA